MISSPAWWIPPPEPCANEHGSAVEEVDAPGLRPDRQGPLSPSRATTTYPDATFTLRLAFGDVKGYEQDGKPIPFETTFAGLYRRAASNTTTNPVRAARRWLERRGTSST